MFALNHFPCARSLFCSASTSTTPPPCARPATAQAAREAARSSRIRWRSPLLRRARRRRRHHRPFARGPPPHPGRAMSAACASASSTRLNLEMACTPAMTRFAKEMQPDIGLPRAGKPRGNHDRGRSRCRRAPRRGAGHRDDAMNAAGIKTSLFIDPDPEQIEMPAELAAPWVELHTGAYANAFLRRRAAPRNSSGCAVGATPAHARRTRGQRRPRHQLRQHRRGPHAAAPARTQHRPQHYCAARFSPASKKPCAR